MLAWFVWLLWYDGTNISQCVLQELLAGKSTRRPFPRSEIARYANPVRFLHIYLLVTNIAVSDEETLFGYGDYV